MIKIKNNFDGIYFCISLSLTTYLVLKALKCPVFIDEAWLTDYINLDFYDIFFYNKEASNTNNHLITTLWFKLIYKFFGLNLFLIRLLSLVSFLVYAWFLKKIIDLFDLPVLSKFLLALTLFLNFLFTQYFYLARGYGIALALLTVIIYLILEKRSVENIYLKFSVITCLCFLMSLSNFSFVFPALSIEICLVILVIKELIPKVNLFDKLLIYTFCNILIFCAFIIFYILPIGKKISVDFPVVSNDFINGSLMSIVLSQIPENIYPLSQIMIFLFFLFIIITIYQAIKNLNDEKSLIFLILTIGIIGQYFANYVFFNIKFPTERLLIPLLFLFILQFYYHIGKLLVLNTFLFCFSLATIYKFSHSMLETKFYRNIYKYDSNVENIVNDVAKLSQGKKRKLATSYESIKNCKYFLIKNDLKNIQLELINNSEKFQNDKYDFIIIEFNNRNNLENLKSYSIRKYYWPSQSYLMIKSTI